MNKDSKITDLTQCLNNSGYKFILVTVKPCANSEESNMESSVTLSLEGEKTLTTVTLAATLAREAKENPELKKFLELTMAFVNDVDEAFLQTHVREEE